MSIQYVVDEQGQKVAVQIPIDEWETIQERLGEYGEDELTPEEAKEADAAWADIQEHPEKAIPIEEVMKQFGISPMGKP